ncbi:MAG TPA: penicillin-binding transpeptidase domain-containing protein, partial [Byssovorax sp.]
AHTGVIGRDDALAMAEHTRFEARVTALLDAGRSRSPARPRHAVAVVAAMTVVATVAACMSPDGENSQQREASPTTPAAPTAAESPAPASPAPPPPAADAALQSLAERELDRALESNHGTGATAIVLDAKTGAAVAIATRGDFDPRAAFPPGSTMKPFTFAAALDSGAVALDARIDCENGKRAYGDRTLTDSSPNGVLGLADVLAVSSNVGTAKLAEPLGDRLADYLRRFHFTAPAHLDTRSLAGASIASGEALPASALEVASGYTLFADAGTYHALDGTTSERVVSQDTARAVLAMLERVITDEHGTGHAARIPNVRVAGKTGTARSHVAGKYYASFVGIVPADAPRFVILVGVDGVDGYGGKVAAPVFATLATAALQE